MNKNILRFIAIISILLIVFTSIISCGPNERLLLQLMTEQTRKSYNFTYSSTLEFNKEELLNLGLVYDLSDNTSSFPDKVYIEFKGEFTTAPLKLDAEFIIHGEDQVSALVYADNNKLYVQLTDAACVVLYMLNAINVIDFTQCKVISETIAFDGNNYIVFDLTAFNVQDFFNKTYITHMDRVMSSDSSFIYNERGSFTAPDLSNLSVLTYDDFYSAYINKLHKEAGYRPYIIDMVFVEENGVNYLYTAVIYENIDIEIKEKIAVDIDISKVGVDMQSLFTAHIIPLRYIAELAGYSVKWDDVERKAFVNYENNDDIYIYGSLINSRTYTSLLTIMDAGFYIEKAEGGDMIQFTLIKK